MSRLKIVIGIEYEGSAFHGWQSQRCGNTVQDVIQTAATAVADSPITIHAAGRTDAGVHATLMLAHFMTPVMRQPGAWVAGINSHLPPTVRLLWAKPVPTDFHARYCAEERHYRYILQNRPTAAALFSRQAAFCATPLDIVAMATAAAHLLGEHDFSAFRAAACQAKTSIRRLTMAQVQSIGDTLIFDFRGNGFLHHMVRNMVGSLIWVGRGRTDSDWLASVLATGNRHAAAPTATAAGLYFCGARYAARFGLPQHYRFCQFNITQQEPIIR